MRGIKYAFLLTLDTKGNIVQALGSSACIRTDGRQTQCTISCQMIETLEKSNNFQDVYVGFELAKGTISNHTIVHRHIDNELLERQLAKMGKSISRNRGKDYVDDFKNHSFNVGQLIELKSKVDKLLELANSSIQRMRETDIF
tara:strand:+ start:61 stop:489 length:429 start_codon:yes stop_codon:yes gene_type:complete